MTKRLLFLLISLGFFGFTIAQEDAGSASEEVVELSADDDEAEPEEVVVTVLGLLEASMKFHNLSKLFTVRSMKIGVIQTLLMHCLICLE